MYRNNIVNFQGSTSILNSCTKKSGNLLNMCVYIYIYIYIVSWVNYYFKLLISCRRFICFRICLLCSKPELAWHCLLAKQHVKSSPTQNLDSMLYRLGSMQEARLGSFWGQNHIPIAGNQTPYPNHVFWVITSDSDVVPRFIYPYGSILNTQVYSKVWSCCC